MGLCTENHQLGGCPAKTHFTLESVYPALPGAEVTVLEDGKGLFDPLGQLSLGLQFEVARAPAFPFDRLGIEVPGGEYQHTAHEERMPDEIPAGNFHLWAPLR